MEAEGVAQLAKWLCSKHSVPGSDPQHSISVVIVACDHSRVKWGVLGVQRHPQLRTEYEAKLDYRRLLKKRWGVPRRHQLFILNELIVDVFSAFNTEKNNFGSHSLLLKLLKRCTDDSRGRGVFAEWLAYSKYQILRMSNKKPGWSQLQFHTTVALTEQSPEPVLESWFTADSGL